MIGPCIIGEVVSHYEVVEKLGEGGMGVVYKALDLRLERFVALKFLSRQITASPETIARFEQEARSISALSHPHISTIYAMEEADLNRRFLVLEYLSGGTLRTRMKEFRARKEPYPIREAVRTAIEIAEGLAHAHRAGIVHRDIKPENVMFNAEGVLRIADFGLAKSTNSEEITRTGTTIGTAAYMAPEQAAENETSPLSDIFSLGILLHEMIAGRRPFTGKSELATMHSLVHDPPPPVRELRADAPPRLEKILLRALEKTPALRYQTAESLAEDLADLYSDSATAELNYEGVTRTMLSLPRIRPKPQRRLAAAATLAVTLAAAGIAAWRGLRHTATTPPENTQLAVLPFTAKSASAEDAAFASGISGIVAARLSAPALHMWLVPGSDLERSRIATPDQAWRVYGARRALTGTIERRPNRTVSIEMKLVDAATGKLLRQATVDGGGPDPALQGEVIRKAIEIVGSDSPDRAKFLAEGAPEAKGANAYEYYLRGVSYLQRFDKTGNVDAAIRSFEEAIHTDPGYALAYAGLSSACWRQYKFSSDSQMLERAREAAMQALSRNETLDTPHITLGAIAVATGRVEEGMQQLKLALDRDPVNADAYREIARAYVSTAKPVEAENAYRQAIQYRPDFWLGYFDLATFYYDRNRYEDSERELQQAVKLTPDNYLVYRNLGTVQVSRGELTEAEKSLRTAAQLRPTGSTYSNLGTFLILIKRYADAIPVLEQALTLSGDERHAYLIWGNLGDAYKWTPGRQAEAARAYEQAIQFANSQLQVNPKQPGLLSLVAFYYAKAGEKKKAEDEIHQALKIAPADSSVLFESALVSELAGDRKKALSTLHAALSAGYSLNLVEREPELARLRDDRHYAAIASHARVR